MSSRKVENEHKLFLDRLLSDSGLECRKSVSESFETVTELEEVGDEGPVHDEEELKDEIIEAEAEKPLVEETQEELLSIFPTPSLRKVLPERVREIEEYNRAHVLPEQFKTDIDPSDIPKIDVTAQQKCIDMLGDITGCANYRCSLAEFWFLDTLGNLLRRAQNDGMRRPSQGVLILWFCEWMKETQHFDAADRQRMLKRFEDNMLSAAKFIAETDRLPTPQEAGVFYRAENENRTFPPTAPESKHLVTFKGTSYECSLRDLSNIIHYIFDLFSTDYQYDLVRSVFTITPEYKLIDAHYQIRDPKRLLAPLKPTTKKHKPPMKEKTVTKDKKKDFDTEEYLALLEVQARDEREREEQEEKDREDWNLRSHILPLSFAADDDFFNKYWPPPPPLPKPEPEPQLKGKGRVKGKK